MVENIPSRGARLALCGLLLMASLSKADDRPADKILEDIKAVQMPARPTDLNDRPAVQAFVTQQQEALARKSDLIGELYKANPGHPELSTLLPQRWQTLSMRPATVDTLKAETAEVAAKSKDEKLVAEAYYYKVVAATRSATSRTSPEELLSEFDVLAKKFPADARLSGLLFSVARGVKDADAKEAIFKRIEKEYPNTTAAAQVSKARIWAVGERHRLETIGKPFELEFTEATKGTQITMAGLKGKVVVIDFWATWCAPCVAEMPTMKKLYKEYKDKGVEFIGVSLDQPKEKGGLDKLKAYVAKNEIEWPQYYQGNYWESEFSMAWGVNSIPCVFLVDADGNLASVEARGQLEKLIPEYLEKAKAKAGANKTASTP